MTLDRRRTLADFYFVGVLIDEAKELLRGRVPATVTRQLQRHEDIDMSDDLNDFARRGLDAQRAVDALTIDPVTAARVARDQRIADELRALVAGSASRGAWTLDDLLFALHWLTGWVLNFRQRQGQ